MKITIKTTILKWTLLLLLMGYTAWVAVWANREANRHKCTGVIVEIVGCDNPVIRDRTKKGIETEMARYPDQLKGVPVHNLDIGKVETYLNSMANFESVHCMINSDNHLLIEAKPLEPVMRVFEGDKSYYINREGKRIETKAEFFADVPVVYGNFNSKFAPRQVLPLVRYLESDRDLANLAGMIEARDARNLIIVPRIKGHVVNFGDTSRLKEKSENLFLFYRKVMPYKGWETYDTISVKYRGQVVATRRNKPTVVHQEVSEEEIDPEELALPEIAAVAQAADSLAKKTNINKTTTP